MSIKDAINPLEYYIGKWKYESILIEIDYFDLEELVKQYITKDSIIILWQMYNIVWGKYENKKIKFIEKAEDVLLYQEVRLFNEVEELRLTKCGDKFYGRYIQDGIGEQIKYVDSFSRLWGMKQKIKDNFLLLEDRGRKLSMKVPLIENASDYNYFGLTTRNYIGIEKNTGLSGYIDYRFLSISSAEYPMKK